MIDDPRAAAPAARPTTADGDGRRPALDNRSIGDLIRELADEGRSLLRSEVSLVKAELSDKVHVYERNSSRIAIGGAFLLAALFFVLWAVNMGVTALLTLAVEEEIAIWLAPLLIGIILAVVGRSMVKGGANEIRHEGLVPERTARTLRDDTRWAKEQVNHG
ncbi:MAG TPA: phage holin family protein [Longimicrobiaceae bacterium]